MYVIQCVYKFLSSIDMGLVKNSLWISLFCNTSNIISTIITSFYLYFVIIYSILQLFKDVKLIQIKDNSFNYYTFINIKCVGMLKKNPQTTHGIKHIYWVDDASSSRFYWLQNLLLLLSPLLTFVFRRSVSFTISPLKNLFGFEVHQANFERRLKEVLRRLFDGSLKTTKLLLINLNRDGCILQK